MIIHPDGRLEGTPEELAAYQKAMQAAPVGGTGIIEKQVPVYIPQPSIPAWPKPPFDIWCGSESVSSTMEGIEVWN